MSKDLSCIKNERERHFASVYFQHDEWISQPKHLYLRDGTRYSADFYDKKQNEYIEVVGSKSAYHHGKAKYSAFRKDYPHLILKILDYRGYPYPEQPQKILPPVKALQPIRGNDKLGSYSCPVCNCRWLPQSNYNAPINPPVRCPFCQSEKDNANL